jgi:hypothetical protein
MTHYVCTGSCKGESAGPGFCEAEFCSKEGQELVQCDCSDELHEHAGEKPEPEDPDFA